MVGAWVEIISEYLELSCSILPKAYYWKNDFSESYIETMGLIVWWKIQGIDWLLLVVLEEMFQHPNTES